jgi:hypothetical protein
VRFPNSNKSVASLGPPNKGVAELRHGKQRKETSSKVGGTWRPIVCHARQWLHALTAIRERPIGDGPGVHSHPAALGPNPRLSKRPAGAILVRIFLFRDRGSTSTFAYSLDVTGRNIPQQTERTKWVFDTVTSDRDMPEDQEAIRHLKRCGYYVFER